VDIGENNRVKMQYLQEDKARLEIDIEELLLNVKLLRHIN
jgi:hypothetical protein